MIAGTIIMKSEHSDLTRGIVLRWTISGAFGWLIALGLLGNIGDVLIDYTLFYQNSILVFAIGAAAISVMQGIALKGYIRSTITWSVLTFVSFLISV